MKQLILATLVMGSISTAYGQVQAISKDFIFDTNVSNTCPQGYPLDCSNGKCCPAGHTLYCPQMEPTPCLDPSKLTDEQVKSLSDHCNPLLSCH